MKILVINGSPKGEYSITLQTVRYLEQQFPQVSFEVLHAGQKIKTLEQDFSSAVEAVKQSDFLLFSYPVYTFLAPSQLHRFLELLKNSGLSLAGKYAAQLTTSKHFYDITAHRYVQDMCQELGLKYIGGLSADMDDLLTEKGQKQARDFLQFLQWSVEKDSYLPFPQPQPAFTPVPATVPEADGAQKPGDVVIVTDVTPEEGNLQAMIARFQTNCPYNTRVVNIWEYPLQGGCLGCFRCAVSGKCIYTDGFDEFLRREIQTAQATVYAFTIKDHSMGPRFKMYDDRQFCNGHRTVTMGAPVGYLVSGPLSREENLRNVIEARASVGGNFLAGVATDEQEPDRQIDLLCQKLAYALEQGYQPPQTFWGVGGMKVFRDLIWLMQGMMRADHKFYKAHGQYDFPQKQWPTMLKMYAVGALLANPKVLAKMGNKMNEGMLMPYKKLLDSTKK
ncbi:MAG: NAD(P)H-dependent oxidoreductase [Clostridia bacterium]|nr:NAD(P)H-dependent oxidoreductase [Clostridia bacterium]